MRVLHVADLHLDQYREQHRDLTVKERVSLIDYLLDLTVMLDPDALVMAGDLFVFSSTSIEAFLYTCCRLSEVDLPILLAPGNHDALAFYRKLRPMLPNNLHVFEDRWEGVPIADGLIWGYASSTDGGISWRDTNPPMLDSQGTNILLFHGSHEEQGDGFIDFVPEEVAQSKPDYVALGHHHLSETIAGYDTLFCYPGRPYVDFDSEQSVRSNRRDRRQYQRDYKSCPPNSSSTEAERGAILVTVDKAGRRLEGYCLDGDVFVPCQLDLKPRDHSRNHSREVHETSYRERSYGYRDRYSDQQLSRRRDRY